jgi:hypothetical protein
VSTYAFAQLDDSNIVTNIIAVASHDCDHLTYPSSESVGQQFLTSLGLSGRWLQVRNTSDRQNANIGYFFDEENNRFIPPQPFPSWTLNEDSLVWEPPVPYPAKGRWQWSESEQDWVAL